MQFGDMLSIKVPVGTSAGSMAQVRVWIPGLRMKPVRLIRTHVRVVHH